MRARRLVWILLALAACSPAPKPAPPAETLGTYWLEDTQLIDTTSVHGVRVIDPRKVVIRADRNVEDATTGATLGLLPEQLMTVPAAHGGVLLYAQEVTPIYLDKPSGKEVGRLYPGARVSVTPGVGESTELNQLGFERWERRLQQNGRLGAFAMRSALGVTPSVPNPPSPGHDARATISPASFFQGDPTGFEALDCVAMVYDPESRQAHQRRSGVEIAPSQGVQRLGPDDWWRSKYCWSSSITHSASGLVLKRTSEFGQAAPEPISAIPEEFSRVQVPLPDALESRIRSNGMLYWLSFYDDAIRCDAWTFRAPEHPPVGNQTAYLETILEEEPPYRWRERLEAELTRSPSIFHPESIHIPVTYWPPTLRDVGRIHFGPVGKPCLHDWEAALYGLVRAKATELHLLSRVHREPLAYLEEEAERWFLSAEACETARHDAQKRLARDGSSIIGLGLHPANYLCGKRE